MKINKLLNSFIASLFMVLVSCKDKDQLQIQKVDRNDRDYEINIYINNPTSENYYILAPQCIISENDFSSVGKLNENDFFVNDTIDGIVSELYEHDKQSIPIILIPSKKTKKLNFKFDKGERWFKNTSIDFPFNIKHEKLSILEKKLNIHIISGYSFYSKTVKDLK
ncbi:hypothetical protein NAL32_03505 [Chryseobacterium sp. Ch-15]|uniref:Lipoprotein n=1 Tax=Chryseobacterium muglaense TaxID=2893752 RepID=A0A9Q3UXV5_9FLAO|nr:hypothetical protein [Chryseobacterium muglaense]MBD3903141.1 hypothetical protein [Chryseobacterium muglaense]MCC9035973.1 hypothetical protein [Chryseobacterium muglaense]MCM2553451.1 hypothetical protein [Chryseobacterium muglaense]